MKLKPNKDFGINLKGDFIYCYSAADGYRLGIAYCFSESYIIDESSNMTVITKVKPITGILHAIDSFWIFEEG